MNGIEPRNTNREGSCCYLSRKQHLLVRQARTSGFPGVGDQRMLYIDLTQSTWETLSALLSKEEGPNQAIRKQGRLWWIGSRMTA